jgi:type I restriction enzyme M protein
MNYIKPKNLSDYASEHLWGIDFDERSSKISKAMMLIAGDGKSHIFKENSLDSSSWGENIRANLNIEKLADKDFKYFNFDILLANPPFAGEITEEFILKQYPNVVKEKQTKISRHLLFIERNLNFVKDGGRLALVLPQGVFNNTSEKYIRDFLADKARILAVIGLDVNTFKPHTGTKTSVIFLQKWDKEKYPRVADYPIFFAVSEKSGKDNSGEYVYREVDGKKILQHDLDEIADEFVRWRKGEGME